MIHVGKKQSRREFLRLAGGVVSISVLAACAPVQTSAPATESGQPAAEVPEVYLWSNMIALTRPEGSDPAKYEAVQNFIMEQTGVKPVGIIPPPGSAGQEKLNLMLAARDEQLDIFQGSWPTYKDAVQPINDLLEQYGQDIVKVESDLGWSGMKDGEGNIWGVPRLGLMGHTYFTWFRTDWMDELGIEFNKESMTWDQMEEILAAFKDRDPEAVVVTNSLNDMRGCLVGGWTEHGYTRWLDESDGLIKPPELQPGFDGWVARMNEWWNRGWFQKETFATMDFEEMLRSGKVGSHVGWYSRITILGQRLMLEGAVPGMQFDFPDRLVGPSGLCMTNNASMTAAKMITKKSKNPQAAIQLMNWQYDSGKDNVCTAVYGIPNEDWEWVDPADKYFVRRLNTDSDSVYAGEFMCSTGLGTDLWYAADDDAWRRHSLHIRDYAVNYDNGKTPPDFDVPYDFAAIQDQVPGLEDINRLINEETTKFITGIRPISEWQDFIGQLYQAGLDDWSTAYTAQYNAKRGG